MKVLNFKVRADRALSGYKGIMDDIDDKLAPIVSGMVNEARRQQNVAERKLKPRYIKINIKVSLGWD